MNLEGQVALVTGASHGLGLAITHALAKEGAALACVARPSHALNGLVSRLGAAGVEAIAAPADVTKDAEVEAAVRMTVERWGRLDIVVLNAGTWKPAKIHETSEADWDFLIDLNLKGAFLTIRHAVPWMMEQRRGTIVGIDSIGGLAGQPGAAAYAASKWGLRGLLESVALELQPRRVRVSIVYPHNMNSDKRALPDGKERDENLEPEDVASLVAFICSAPDQVAIGNATIWPIAAGIRSVTGSR